MMKSDKGNIRSICGNIRLRGRVPATINRGRLCSISQLETDWTADQGDQEAHLVIINEIGQPKVAGRRPGRSATRCKKVTCCV